MPSLESLTFDTLGFSLVHEEANARFWAGGSDDVLSLNFFPLPPDLPTDLANTIAIRSAYAGLAAVAGHALLELARLDLSSARALRVIFKQPQVASGGGRIYVGSITLPFRDLSFVIKVTCPEHPPFGVREAIVLDQLMRSGELQLLLPPDETPDPLQVIGLDRIAGWLVEPIDPNVPPHLAHNRSDDQSFDDAFPSHPLTRTRRYLDRLQSSISLGDDLQAAPRFER